MKIKVVLLSCAFLAACNGVTFKTNVDDYYIASHMARSALYEFRSGQQAIESGAILLGATEGMSCLSTQQSRGNNIDFSGLKKQAIESLKLDALNLGANAYLLEQCKLFNYKSFDCEQAYVCTGQAYDYQ